jgi:hypothetical protein
MPATKTKKGNAKLVKRIMTACSHAERLILTKANDKLVHRMISAANDSKKASDFTDDEIKLFVQHFFAISRRRLWAVLDEQYSDAVKTLKSFETV